MSTVIFLAFAIGFPIVCGIWAMQRHRECPRERMGYNCHVYWDGHCNACGRSDSKLTRKRG